MLHDKPLLLGDLWHVKAPRWPLVAASPCCQPHLLMSRWPAARSAQALLNTRLSSLLWNTMKYLRGHAAGQQQQHAVSSV